MLHTIAIDVPDARWRSDVEAQRGAVVADVCDASWSIEDVAGALAADSEDPGFERPDDPDADLRAWQAWAADFARSKPGRTAQTLGRLLVQATAVLVGEHYRASKTSGHADLFSDEQVEVLGGSYSGLDPQGYRETFDKVRARVDGLRRTGAHFDVWVAGLFLRWEVGAQESEAEELFVPLGRKERRAVPEVSPERQPTAEELVEYLVEELGYDEEEVLEVVRERRRRRR